MPKIDSTLGMHVYCSRAPSVGHRPNVILCLGMHAFKETEGLFQVAKHIAVVSKRCGHFAISFLQL